ncbi:MAG: hypothetical protein QOJ90_1736 [Actinomycetota bacterium]|nr:hypothetical protein [Actinomycetota bacterium]
MAADGGRQQTQEWVDGRDRFYQGVLAGATDVAVVCDRDTTTRWISPSVTSVCGHDAGAILGSKIADLVHPEDRPAFDALIKRVSARPGTKEDLEIRVRHADGEWHWSAQHVTNLLDDDDVQGLVFNSIDITERRAVEEDLSSREQFLRVVLETAHEGVWVLDADGDTVLANRRMREMLGVRVNTLMSQPLADLVEPALAAEIHERLVKRQAGVAESYELHVRPLGRADVWVAVSAAPLPPGFSRAVPTGGTIALVADITDRKAYEESLRQHALYDQLTGLPSRAFLEEDMRGLTERHERTGSHYGYLLCDIDGLKLVNAGLGSDAGDQVIREVGQRLAEAIRDGDRIARTTGDQFVVLCADAESFQVERIARDLVAEVAGPLDVDGSAIQPSISIGAVSTSDVEPRALVSAAGAALHHAKQQGQGSVALFNAAAPRDPRSRLELLADLREAVTTGAMRLHYQPVVRLSTNEVTGAEALMRWHRPGYGEVPPSVFIPLAEETGLIAQLGRWSLHQACRDAATWPGSRAVAVNLSARQLQDDLVDTVRDALQTSGLPADRLWLEVTETAVFGDVPLAAERLRAVVDLGVRISLDDFGTGYSSLANLRDFPVHALKLDRSFIAGLGRNPDDTAIVTTLIQLAATLKLNLIAEGVETAEQAHRLRRLGCDQGQGYLWRPPVADQEFVDAISDIENSGPLDTEPALPARRTARPDQAVVARIMSLHARGASPSSIAATLNAEDISAPTGNRWHRATIAVVVADQQSRASG